MESVVKRLLQIGSDEFVREILGVFLTEVPRRVERMRAGVEAGDAAAVAHSAHALRGSCGNLGAEEAEALCGRIEQRAAAGELAGLAPALDELEASLTRFCDNLRTEHRDLLEGP